MQAHTLSAQASLVTPSRKRFFIMVLLFITVVINYLDRSNLSIAAPALTSDLGIDPPRHGFLEAWAKQGGQALLHQIEQGDGYFIFAQ